MYGERQFWDAAAILVAASALASGALADDAVGVMRVDAGTNGLVEVEMPFVPMSDIGPLCYVAGLFDGDGGEFSDRLYRRDAATGETTNAVWSADGWLDPAALLPSLVQALPGDALYFMRTDVDPFDFSVFGRFHGLASPSCGPVFSALSVDPVEKAVLLGVSPSAAPYDILSAHGTNAADAAASAWLHVARSPACDAACWSDPLPPPGFARLYMVSDAARDTDGDGLPDGLESRVYGTSPLLADTDGDGIPDGREIAWGSDPLTSAASQFSWFEGFERPSVIPGDIAGQNGWSVAGQVSAVVREGVSFEGDASLSMRSEGDGSSVVSRGFTVGADEFWVDMRVRGGAMREFEDSPDCAVAMCFLLGGGFVATDGPGVRTNAAVIVDDDAWTRVTLRLDYGARRWDAYVDGVVALGGLAMRGTSQRPSVMGFTGASGEADAVLVTTGRPLGLSSDGDQLPDEWEFSAFGSLSRDGLGDFDSDGLADFGEFRAGTDPLSPDTDGDGIPDGWEASNGLDPIDPADAPLDPDGDGLSNSTEFALGTDPGLFEPDPRLARPDLRAEFSLTPGDLQDIPDFASLKPFAVSAVSSVAFSDGLWPAPVELRGNDFACRIYGFVLASATGRYAFYVASDDGSRLVVDGTVVTSDTPPHSVRETTGSIHLAAGWHSIELLYYENSGNAVLSLEWSGPGFAREPIPAASLCHVPENIAPAVSISVSEGPYVDGQEVAVSASAHDVDGHVASVAVYDGETLLASAEGDGLQLCVRLQAAGTHVLRAVAVDSHGATAEADVVIAVEECPAAYSPGLECEYYAFASELARIPDVSDLAPAATGIAQRVCFPATTLAWEGAPEGLANRYSVLFAGALMVREAGMYTLSLASDDGSRLWIDGAPAVDNDGNHSMNTVSASLPLSAGLHDLRIEYYENDGDAGLELSWTRPCGASEVIPQGCLFHLTGTPDSDSDGMPDWWENMYSLDPHDPSDASLDPDGDGLSNSAEHLAGTSPLSPDTDSDGMPDAWEVVNGLCPFVNDALADPDSDGLVNAEEFLGGSAPVEPDTDGDGISDYEERMQLGTDPTVADSVSLGDLVASSNAGRGVGFVVSSPRAFAVDVSLLGEWRDYGAVLRPSPVAHQVLFRVDGRHVASRDIPFDSSNIVHVVFYTPVLPVGPHEVSVEWRSPDFRARADVAEIAVNEVSGVEFSDVVRRRNSVPAGIVSSLASPAFVEGTALFPWLVSATGATVRPCGSGSWYMDVPLSPVGGSSVEVLFEGLVATNVVVAWEAADLFSGVPDIAVRQGSSLLFSGIPRGERGGSVQVFTNGTFACSYDSGASAALAFAAEGVWLVHAAWIPEGQGEPVVSDAVQVTCRGGAFPSASPACFAGQARTWACPGISTNLVFQTDAYTHLSKTGDGTLGLLVDDTRGERVVAARLFEGGPVLDAARICPMWAVDSFGNEAYLVDSSDDVDRCRCYMRQHGAPPDVSFRVRSYTSSVFLDDFSTERWIGPSAFDKDGVAWFELVKSKGMAAPCHTVEAYQGGIRIGEAVYGNGTLPEELR